MLPDQPPAHFGPFAESEAGEKNGQERVECGRERPIRAAGEVRRLPQELPTIRGNRRDRARKNPNRERLGFLRWWRRRESNPRPQVLCRWIYMLIPVYCFSRLLPDGQGKQPAILKGFSGSAPGLPCRELVCVDA